MEQEKSTPVDRTKGWVRSSVANPDYDKKASEFEERYLKKAEEHIGQNVVQI